MVTHTMLPVHIVWFRRDLRIHDNTALYHALKSGRQVLPVFIFDPEILDALEDRDDTRVTFIHDALNNLRQAFEHAGSSLLVLHAPVDVAWNEILERFPVEAVHVNHDYEPYARQRDERVCGFLASRNISFHTYKDQVIFEKDELLTAAGKPYTVYTPYCKAWKARFAATPPVIHNTRTLPGACLQHEPFHFPTLQELGFSRSLKPVPPTEISDQVLLDYADIRDIPGVSGTSRLSVHLRFGTISIRELVIRAAAVSEKYLNELIWREFYMMIIWHFPQVVHQAFKPAYDRIRWRSAPEEFDAWCEGRTGFPLVDAGMRELMATGYMHNRVRMITASFLTKHLLINWRLGEAWFARHLLDFELSSNNGGWQWTAGTGCDAAPYFRIFNPISQQEKFDPDFRYVRKWVPEFGTPAYPKPMMDLNIGRERCLLAYKEATG